MKKIISAIICAIPSICFSLPPGIEAGVDVAPRVQSCSIHSECIVTSSHRGNIINHNSVPYTIFVVYKICPQNETCKMDRYKVVVRPGKWTDGKIMTYQARYHQKGNFFVDATTFIYSADGINLAEVTKRGFTQVL